MASEDGVCQKMLQTLAVSAMVFTQVGLVLIMPLFCIYITLATKYWWICLLYFTWCYIFGKDADLTGEWRSEWVRSWSWWTYAKNYYPLKVVKLPWGELDKKRNYMFCYFPHGLLAAGSYLTIATNATEFQKYFPNHKSYIHTAAVFYRVPFVRELGLSAGGIKASKEALENILGKESGGNISALIVGGAQEAYYSNPGVHKIIYKNRKGFIKIALKNGAPLVPVYVFGESELYSQPALDQDSFFHKLREPIRRNLGFSVIFPVGRLDMLGLVPKKVPLAVVEHRSILNYKVDLCFEAFISLHVCSVDMMRLFNIEFAPLNVSLERRLQTFGVMMILLVQVTGIFIFPPLCYYMVFHTNIWWVCILYFLWYIFFDGETPEQDGRRSNWVRSWSCWVHARDFFPMKMLKLPGVELDSKRNYIFCYVPHGMLATGTFLTMATNALGFGKLFPHHTPYAHTISMLFKVPFVRDLVLGLGGVSVTEKSINYVQSRPNGGNVSSVVIGGAAEAYFCKPGLNKLVLKKRKGFVRIALRNGSSLVPVYSFGETDIYSQWDIEENSFLAKFRDVIKRVSGCAIVLIKGRGIFQYSFGILPQRRPVTVVVGEPIDVEKTENPTQEQIDHLHQLFQTKLVELFESQKKYYLKDHETAHLEIC